jgi:hypothetical protein
MMPSGTRNRWRAKAKGSAVSKARASSTVMDHHCEERTDEAIHVTVSLDCIALVSSGSQ